MISELIIYGNEEEHIKAATSCVPLITFGSERIYLLFISLRLAQCGKKTLPKKRHHEHSEVRNSSPSNSLAKVIKPF